MLEDLSPDILLHYLLPQLGPEDALALAGTNRHLHRQISQVDWSKKYHADFRSDQAPGNPENWLVQYLRRSNASVSIWQTTQGCRTHSTISTQELREMANLTDATDATVQDITKVEDAIVVLLDGRLYELRDPVLSGTLQPRRLISIDEDTSTQIVRLWPSDRVLWALAQDNTLFQILSDPKTGLLRALKVQLDTVGMEWLQKRPIAAISGDDYYTWAREPSGNGAILADTGEILHMHKLNWNLDAAIEAGYFSMRSVPLSVHRATSVLCLQHFLVYVSLLNEPYLVYHDQLDSPHFLGQVDELMPAGSHRIMLRHFSNIIAFIAGSRFVHLNEYELRNSLLASAGAQESRHEISDLILNHRRDLLITQKNEVLESAGGRYWGRLARPDAVQKSTIVKIMSLDGAAQWLPGRIICLVV